MSKKNSKSVTNRHAIIRTRTDRRGNLRTETARRDEGTVAVAVSTNPKSNSTVMFVDSPEGDAFRFDGRTARTIYRALQKHYESSGTEY